MYFRVRSRNQTIKFGVAHEQLTAPEGSKNEQIENQIHTNKGVVHKEFVPQGQTVNQHYYREVLERLRKRVHPVRPEIADNWMLHHHNDSLSHCHSIKEFLTKKGIPWGSAAPILT